jgi:hypothetical protein
MVSHRIMWTVAKAPDGFLISIRKLPLLNLCILHARRALASISKSTLANRKFREFPDDSFEKISLQRILEEETCPGYKADRFYPVRLG